MPIEKKFTVEISSVWELKVGLLEFSLSNVNVIKSET